MKSYVKILLLLSLLLPFLYVPLSGQEITCSSRLEEAREKFDAGLVQEVPGLLMDCIKSGFTREERLNAYKLLINAYIFDDNPGQAEAAMVDFLAAFPGYKASPDDSPEFLNLLGRFDNRPRGEIGFFLGTNLSAVHVQEAFGVHDLNRTSADYRPDGAGFQTGIDYYLFVLGNLELNLEPMFMINKFSYQLQPYPFTTVDYTESQIRAGLPASFIYTFGKNKIHPYVRAGGAALWLLSAKGKISRVYDNKTDNTHEVISNDNMDVTNDRKRLNLQYSFGGGIRYRMPHSYFFLDLRYNAGTGNQVKPGIRNNSTNENTWVYYYVQDDFRLSNFSVNIGLTKILYRPREK